MKRKYIIMLTALLLTLSMLMLSGCAEKEEPEEEEKIPYDLYSQAIELIEKLDAYEITYTYYYDAGYSEEGNNGALEGEETVEYKTDGTNVYYERLWTYSSEKVWFSDGVKYTDDGSVKVKENMSFARFQVDSGILLQNFLPKLEKSFFDAEKTEVKQDGVFDYIDFSIGEEEADGDAISYPTTYRVAFDEDGNIKYFERTERNKTPSYDILESVMVTFRKIGNVSKISLPDDVDTYVLKEDKK